MAQKHSLSKANVNSSPRPLTYLTVGQKISISYGVALAIAVIGTTSGIVLGNQYQEHATHLREDRVRENQLIHSLQVSLLHTQLHYYELKETKITFEKLTEELKELPAEIAQLKQLWLAFEEEYTEVDSREDPEEQAIADRILERYSPLLIHYFSHFDSRWDNLQTDSLTLAQEIELKAKLLELYNPEDIPQLHKLLEELTQLNAQLEEEGKAAEALIQKADQVRTRIIAGSILVSGIIAILCAIITSRIITRPLRSLTSIAQKVTEESNFELQASVKTQDEIGQLAISLNQLIRYVKKLLAEQQAATTEQLLQSEKMSSLGRMLAGVAHEINNPVNFIYGNILHATEYVDDLLALLQTYQTEITNPPEKVQEQIDEIDLEFLEEDLPKLLHSMQIGADRTRQIVLSLKNFSRLDEAQARPVDLQDCLESTLLILHNRLKKGVKIARNYGEIPKIEGFSSSLYQVFMNIMSNALDALLENQTSDPTITVTTELYPDKPGWIAVHIQDNGCGIPPEQQTKIFEAFFTTKPVGIGTGLGLAISRQLILEKHHGEILLHSEVGKGTEFTILLPIVQPTESTSKDRKSHVIEPSTLGLK